MIGRFSSDKILNIPFNMVIHYKFFLVFEFVFLSIKIT
jgi:hypothetical protein